MTRLQRNKVFKSQKFTIHMVQWSCDLRLFLSLCRVSVAERLTVHRSSPRTRIDVSLVQLCNRSSRLLRVPLVFLLSSSSPWFFFLLLRTLFLEGRSALSTPRRKMGHLSRKIVTWVKYICTGQQRKVNEKLTDKRWEKATQQEWKRWAWKNSQTSGTLVPAKKSGR